MTQTPLPSFDQLVTTEAAVRMESVHRRHIVTLSEGKDTKEYEVGNPDAGTTKKEVANNLFTAFLHIYDFAYQDSSQHQKVVKGTVCNTDDLKELNPQDYEKLRGIITEFVKNNYNEAGELTLIPAKAPTVMQALYEELGAIPLHRSELARGALFVEMGQGKKWADHFPRGIDFTRGEPSTDLKQRFKDAFEGSNHPKSKDVYPPLPESIVKFNEHGLVKPDEAGYEKAIAFAVKPDVDGWRTHLVTQDGHLVDLTNELKKEITDHIRSGKLLDELRVDIKGAQRLGDYQDEPLRTPGGNNLRQQVGSKIRAMPQRKSIDGLPARDKDGQARLMCMDMDMLTGLALKSLKEGETSEFARFKSYLAKETGGGFIDLIPKDFTTNIYAKATESEREPLRKELRDRIKSKLDALADKAHNDNPDMEDIIRCATPHLEAALPRIYESADKQFVVPEDIKPFNRDSENKVRPRQLKAIPPEKNKRVYMTMGGSASGKSGIKRIADAECDGGRSLVVASLDDARIESERYWLYAATNNHNDDYKATEQFGNAIRDLITKRAIEGGYNLYIDGSGIPYENRNDKTILKLKEKGYHTSVIAVQAPLALNDPEGYKALDSIGRTHDTAFRRIEKRMAEELRGLVQHIVAEKHIGFALASRNAARDPNVDRYMVLDSTVGRGRASTLSYVLTLSQKDMKEIVPLKGKELKAYLLQHKKMVPSWVTLPDNDQELYNLKVVRDIGNKTYRVEIITDMEQYIGMVQKGLLNRNATGQDGLFDNTVQSDVLGYFHGENGKLKLQQSKGTITVDKEYYRNMMSRTHPNLPGAGRG